MRKHVATSLDILTEHLIVNKAVATIVKSEVHLKTKLTLQTEKLSASVLRGSFWAEHQAFE